MSVEPLLSKWEVRRLEELSSAIQYGYTAKATTERLGPKLLRITDIQNDAVDWDAVPFCEISPKEIEKYRLGKNDLLFARTGATVGKSYLIPGSIPDSVFASYLIRVRLLEDVIPKYVAYFFRSLDYWRQITETQAGIGQPNVNGTKLAQIKIPVAPLKQQKLIVAEIEKQFSRLDEAVANLKRVKANLKRYKAAVLKAAVEGKLTEDWRKQHPNVQPASKLLERILAERRAKWKGRGKYKEPYHPDTSDLPSLPKGWTWARWEQIGFSQNGRAFPSSQYQPTGIKLLRPGNLHVSGKVVWTEDNTRCMPQKWAHEFPESIVGPRELIMNLTAQSLKDEFLGRVCLTGSGEACLLNQRLARLSPVLVLSEFLLWLFKSSVFRRFVNELNTGSLIQHMFTSQLADFVLPLPPLAEQQVIIAEVERRLSVIDELETTVEANLTRAARLRQATLQKAFSGKLLLNGAHR